MKELLKSLSTTSVIAVLIILLGFVLLFGTVFLPSHVDASTRTQVISIDSAIMMLAASYYFGSSKQRNPSINADTVTNLNTGNQSPDQSGTDNSPTK